MAQSYHLVQEPKAPATLRMSPAGVRLLITMAALFCAACPGLLSQASSSQTPPPAKRDQSAVELLEKSIHAMQGSNFNPAALHGIAVSGTTMYPGSSSPVEFTWTDDWSSGVRFKREMKDAAGNRSVIVQASGSALAPVPPPPAIRKAHPAESKPTTQLRRQRFDSVSSLLVHLPEAALYLAMHSDQYSITNILPPRDMKQTASCVHIQSFRFTAEADPTNLIVCLSAESDMPIVSYLGLVDMFHPGHYSFESIRYRDFQRSNGMLIPMHISVMTNPKMEKVITVQQVSWNPQFSAK